MSLKNNRRSGSGRAQKHLAGKEAIAGVKSHRTPSAGELEKIRTRLKLENRRRQQKLVIISAVFVLLLIAFFGYFMF